jgi:hypothetical protein
MYISWNKYTARRTADILKEVTCEKCGTQYMYGMQRTEEAQGVSLYGLDDQGAQDRAVQAANENLQRALESAFELVPCPQCGAYQSQMIAFLKNAHLKWLSFLGAVLAAGAIVFYFGALAAEKSSVFAGTGSLSMLVAGIGMIVFKRWSASRMDPNAGDPEPRRQLGKKLATLKEDLGKGSREK